MKTTVIVLICSVLANIIFSVFAFIIQVTQTSHINFNYVP